MGLTRIGQRMRRAGIAVLAAAISAKAGMMPYASNVQPLPYSIGGLMVNDSGDPGLPQTSFIPSVENVTEAPPNVETGIFPVECHTCSAQASGLSPLLSPSFFALVVHDVISEVTGNVLAPSNANAPYQEGSFASVNWLPPPLPWQRNEPLNAGSETFISEVTENVLAPAPDQEGSFASVNWLANFVPGGTPNPGIGGPNPSSGVLLWSQMIPISPLIPIVSAPPVPSPGQLTIQGVVYQNATTLPLVAGVPEPATFSLIGLALLGLRIVRRKRVSS